MPCLIVCISVRVPVANVSMEEFTARVMTNVAVLSSADTFVTSIAAFLAHHVEEPVNIRARIADVATNVANLVAHARYVRFFFFPALNGWMFLQHYPYSRSHANGSVSIKHVGKNVGSLVIALDVMNPAIRSCRAVIPA